ncbi:MAG: nitronate monooxygenase [Chloroflexi bacterium]|nr:nitronate monooxygenase [Chloroflexota bacterium]
MSQKVLRTWLCDLLDIEYPIILAGMAECAHADLAAAVSEAGGLGMIGAMNMTPDELDAAIRKVKSLTGKPFGVDSIAPLGTVQTVTVEELRDLVPDENGEYAADLGRRLGIPVPEGAKLGRGQGFAWAAGLTLKQIEVVYEHKVPVFAAGLGSPGFMVPEAHRRGMKVMGVVGTVKQAVKEAEADVDIIIAQGHEAGGHTGYVATMPLVPQVVDAVHPRPVVAAGGIADGRGLVAALSLGACGVWCGTAFISTYEANFDQGFKDQVLQATERDTRVTRVLTGKTARLINTKLIETWEAEGGPLLPFPLQLLVSSDLFQVILESGHREHLLTPAGQICGMIKEMKSARQVVKDMVDQAVRILEEDLPSRVKFGS